MSQGVILIQILIIILILIPKPWERRAPARQHLAGTTLSEKDPNTFAKVNVKAATRF